MNSCLGDRQRDRERCIGAETRLVFGAVEHDQRLVDEALLDRVEPDDRFADFRVDVLDRALHAFAEITLVVAIAQLDRLARAGRSARRHGGAAQHAGFEQHVGLHRRQPPRIKYLARNHIHYRTHDFP